MPMKLEIWIGTHKIYLVKKHSDKQMLIAMFFNCFIKAQISVYKHILPITLSKGMYSITTLSS